MARPRKTTATPPAEDWSENASGNDAGANAARDEADEDNEAEGQSGDEDPEEEARVRAAEADDEDPDEEEGDEDFAADLAAVSRVDHDAPQPAYQDENGNGLAIGSALTPAQQNGVDPVDLGTHVRQAADRAPLTNAQTDHEHTNALDAISGTANPGILRDHGHSAPGILGASDMSGRTALPDASLGTQAREALSKLQEASRKAIADRKRGHGWLNLRELNVNKATMDALHGAGYVDRDTRSGVMFSPETGTVYRIKGHEEPDLPPPPADA